VSTDTEGEKVKNDIARALKNRIIRAKKENKPFKVYVVVPLLPGFEGDIADESASAVVRCQLRLMQETIGRGNKSLLA